MFRNYLKIAFRSLKRNRVSSFINISGLSIGIAVAVLTGLWIWDELSWNKCHQNYDRIAEVWQQVSSREGTFNFPSVPIPLSAELRKSYASDFKYAVNYSPATFLVAVGDNRLLQDGAFMEQDAPDMLSLKMLRGSRAGLQDNLSILLAASSAKALFGQKDPLGQTVKMNNSMLLKVTGVYEDLPQTSNFRDLHFIAPWNFFVTNWDWIRPFRDDWSGNICRVFVQLNPNADLNRVEQKIRDIRQQKAPDKEHLTKLILYPMSRWHLHSEFKNGAEQGGLITYVWLFGCIGGFVLLLACINFMNLSTARSEKRAREVGIRKAIGSRRWQLVSQFFSESILVSLLAFFLSLLLILLILPWFNGVAGKSLSIPLFSPAFWTAGIGFSILTGIIAGSYPAVYLSSFRPVKVLKGVFRSGRLAALPRKVLVVMQFSISVLLITGTIVVFRQIQFAKDRPVGYDRQGLIALQERTPDIYTNYSVIRNTLLQEGSIVEMAESQCPVTDIWAGSSGFDWKGKDPGMEASFASIAIRHEYGKTVGWKFVEGRDFSTAFTTDSSGLVLNESAVRYMGIKDPVGQTIRWNKKDYKVLGVIKDMVMASPYEPIPPTIYSILHEGGNFINIRLTPSLPARVALKKVEAVFRQFDPSAPFSYTFIDQDYAKKFGTEERIGKLAFFFAVLAILISCMGLFGLASYVAEQRTKEIGVRKVLGASVFDLWRLLSRDFVLLVIIASCIAFPAAYFSMHGWLQHYTIRTGIPWWIFLLTGAGALILTLATVSTQAIRAALMNPVRSLRTE